MTGRTDKPVVVFVPGMRFPGRAGQDVAVFRLFARQLTRRSALGLDPEDLFAYAYGRAGGTGRTGGAAIIGWGEALHRPPRYGARATTGRVERLADRLAAALADFRARMPARPVLVVGYSIGGTAAVLSLAGVDAVTRQAIRGVVTLAAPLAGLDTARLREVFGPPMLSRGIGPLDSVVRLLYRDLDVRARVEALCEHDAPHLLDVAVEGDVVAPPSTAMIGWPDAPPFGVEWLRVAPRMQPPPTYRRLGDLAEAIASVGTLHSEVIVRRDVVSAVIKYLERCVDP